MLKMIRQAELGGLYCLCWYMALVDVESACRFNENRIARREEFVCYGTL